MNGAPGSRLRRSAPRAARAGAVVLALGIAHSPWSAARADEGGASFWIPGQEAQNLAAMMPGPGWSVPVTFYYYDGSAPASATATGSAVAPGTLGRTWLLGVAPTYAPATPFLGGQLALSVSLGVGGDWTQVVQGLPQAAASQTVWGLADVAPSATLGWQHGAGAWAVYVTGNIPVGSYDSTRLSNVGLGRAALDAGGLFTHQEPNGGPSASTAVGVTYNFTNPDTDYRSGIDAHLGASAMVPLSASWRAGLTGYVYYQLTADGGNGNGCGPCKSRVAGVGPQVNYAFDVAGQSWSANLRGYYEFWARNRLQGYAAFASLSIPL